MSLQISKNGSLYIVELDRPDRRNAVDRETASALAEAFREFDRDDEALVGVLSGKGNDFCAGADLKEISRGNINRLSRQGDGPMGPTRQMLTKPTIAAIEGAAVAGGLELALWCDLRVCAEDAFLGVTCRDWGIPLIDGGTVRLPRLIGLGEALDLILTGREIGADEAKQIGLVNRLTESGNALDSAIEMAKTISEKPQICMRNDRLSTYEQMGLKIDEAIDNEFERGMDTVSRTDLMDGAEKFLDGDNGID